MDRALSRTISYKTLRIVIAYKNVGKQREAEIWARQLVELLECADILRKD